MRSKEERLKAGRRKVVEIDCGEFGTVKIQQLSLPDLVNSDQISWPYDPNEVASLMIKAAVNDDGSPMFAEEDRAALVDLQPTIHVRFINGFREANRVTTKQVEEAEKNS